MYNIPHNLCHYKCLSPWCLLIHVTFGITSTITTLVQGAVPTFMVIMTVPIMYIAAVTGTTGILLP